MNILRISQLLHDTSPDMLTRVPLRVDSRRTSFQSSQIWTRPGWCLSDKNSEIDKKNRQTWRKFSVCVDRSYDCCCLIRVSKPPDRAIKMNELRARRNEREYEDNEFIDDFILLWVWLNDKLYVFDYWIRHLVLWCILRLKCRYWRWARGRRNSSPAHPNFFLRFQF